MDYQKIRRVIQHLIKGPAKIEFDSVSCCGHFQEQINKQIEIEKMKQALKRLDDIFKKI